MPTTPTQDPEPHATDHSFSDVLQALAADTSRDRISVADLLTALGDRALAALMFVFAAPNVLPVPPGTSAILGAPLVFLAAQLAFGRRPWLPRFVSSRSMSHGDFATVVGKLAPWLARAERLMRPRLSSLALPPMEYVVGMVCLLMSIVLVLPIPLGNVIPALSISVLVLGILERDGLWVLAGVLIAIFASILVSGVLWALAKAAVYLVVNVLS